MPGSIRHPEFYLMEITLDPGSVIPDLIRDRDDDIANYRILTITTQSPRIRILYKYRRGDMQPATVCIDSITIRLDTGPDIVDVTGELNKVIHDSKIKAGNLMATIVGSTGSITTLEYEPGVVDDLKEAINRIAPPGIYYAHEEAWHDGNGHSHVQAALLGPSISLPGRAGRLKLGTWQLVVVINHDNKPRQRSVEVTIIGQASG